MHTCYNVKRGMLFVEARCSLLQHTSHIHRHFCFSRVSRKFFMLLAH